MSEPRTGLIIETLQSAIQARHVMTPRASFVAGVDAKHALSLLGEDKYRDFDIVPFPKSGQLVGYISRSSGCEREISREDLISDSTPVIELVQYFEADRNVLFVLTGNKLCGLVHVSDLNSALCKIAFFTLVENVERMCLETFRSDLPRELLEKTLDEERLLDLDIRTADLKQKGVLPFDAAALYFSDALKLVRQTGLIKLSSKEIHYLSETRNRIAHAGRQLYSEAGDLKMLRAVVQLSWRLLADFEKLNEVA